MSIEECVKGFIASDKPSAIAIKGKWGEGKTHFWNRAAREHAPASALVRPNYAYVSLFGLNSLGDLRAALAQNIRPVAMIDQDTFAALLDLDGQAGSKFARVRHATKTVWKGLRSRDWRSRAGQRITRTGKVLADSATSANVGIPHVGNLGPFYRAYAYSKVRNALICVDDLERRGSGLALKDVMGLTSQLVTERGCSVVVILNDGTLEGKDKEVWNANREKVLSGELTYQTTPDICVGYIYTNVHPALVDQFAIDAILNLGLTNVRIIERIKGVCDLVFATIDFPISVETTKHIVKCLVLLVYMHAGQGEGAPPIHEGKKSSLVRTFVKMNQKEEKKEPTEDELRWDAQLSKYNFHFHGEMDDLLNDAVRRGYPEVQALHQAIRDYDARVAAEVSDAKFGAAWDLFHGHFTDNGTEVIAKMSEAFFNIVDSVSATNADSSIRLMRAFGEIALANRMVTEWVSSRAEDRWPELEQREVEMFEPIRDEEFKKAVTDAYASASIKNLPNFEDVMARLTPNYHVSNDDLNSLCREPVAGYVRYFRNIQGREMATAARSVMTFNRTAEPEKSKQVRDNAHEAMKLLAAESLTNRVRVEWKYGDIMSKQFDTEEHLKE